MSRSKEKEIKEIRIAVEKEFTEDPALQQVHIARKIIAKEADSEGLSILEYIKLLVKQVKNIGLKGAAYSSAYRTSCPRPNHASVDFRYTRNVIGNSF